MSLDSFTMMPCFSATPMLYRPFGFIWARSSDSEHVRSIILVASGCSCRVVGMRWQERAGRSGAIGDMGFIGDRKKEKHLSCFASAIIFSRRCSLLFPMGPLGMSHALQPPTV